MLRFVQILATTTVFNIASLAGTVAQNTVTPSQVERRDPNYCGAAGAGCDPAEIQQWKAVGNRLADLSSADLSQYAYACVQHKEWKTECETDPPAVLKKLGIEGY